MKISIPTYIHRCVVRDGPAAGNKNWVEVSPYDIEFGIECDECGEVLATPAQIVAHIYQELTT